MLSEVRQPLIDIVELYCHSIAESQIDDNINFMPTVTAAAVTDVMHAVQQARRLVLLTSLPAVDYFVNWNNSRRHFHVFN